MNNAKRFIDYISPDYAKVHIASKIVYDCRDRYGQVATYG